MNRMILAAAGLALTIGAADAAPERVRRGAALQPQRVDHVVVEDRGCGNRRGRAWGAPPITGRGSYGRA